MSYFPPGGGGESALEATEIIIDQTAEISTTNQTDDPRVIAKYKVTGLDDAITGSKRGVFIRTEFLSGDVRTENAVADARVGIYESDDDESYSTTSTAINESATSYFGVSDGNRSIEVLDTIGENEGYIVIGLSISDVGDTAFLRNFRFRAFLFLPTGATIERII